MGLSLILIVVYRVILRRRRDNLRRRIEAGEVDVEYLSLNQIKVPRDVVEKMPLYVFPNLASQSQTTLVQEGAQHGAAEVDSSDQSINDEHSSMQEKTEIKKPEPAVVKPGTDSAATSTSQFRLSHTQTTCAICLDDFVAGTSTVRELPCGHIFDPECIDPFLTENSSLCPLCKKSVLPPGSLNITVTNDMVRQDHASRHNH